MSSGYYTWSVAGKPVRVEIALPVIERLGAVIIEEFRIDPGARRESLGLLDGRHWMEGRQRVVAIDDFECVETLPDHLPAGAVGIFTGRASQPLRLDPVDAARIEHLFRRPELVYLVIRPEEGAPAAAAFFIQEQGQIHGYSPYREFPFHAGLLATGGFPLSDGRATVPDIRRPSGLVTMALIALAATAAAPLIRGRNELPGPVAAAPAAVQPALERAVPQASRSETTVPAGPRRLRRAGFAGTRTRIEPARPGRSSRLLRRLMPWKRSSPRRRSELRG